ncbi:PTS system cellobiose-specific IIC component [Breznakia sp. PF5-3]|uniref:PTS sugar transporter subunit IIC n=1 Tax=unclassified Breznakia TaxID=2623764 RepID=UPI002406DAC8|nr:MULTISPECIES: PTS transporter subunit EIIC [unclassified Breznakia]MDF9824283.1 PTS system cellobiose-specific IIC component [Breznakia sp. PM6-1]MDF9835507.1 PTS system cellobiose-specific IIC component [Breznakia sp. PF5-3]MDF9838019.1 PTS system cellobiose-specific IIC component [Breznakia sp. PFB2-8]MDF9859397.1 PTS system cellobiose-specific IIC component [Breznakia sp. PH5-24]
MQKLIDWLENSFAPKMNKINHNVWVVTLKDSVMQILPFILLGSLFCVGAVVENYVDLPFSFWTPFGWTMGMVSLLVAFLIPFNFCEKKRLRKQRLIAGSSGIILFLISITPEVVAEGAPGFGSSALGAGGMFCAIVTGILTCIVFNLFGKFSFFKEDSAIPDFVRQWFDSLLPIFIIIFGGFILVQVAGVNLYGIVTSFFEPLGAMCNTWYGFILMNFITCFIYSMGISSWVLTPATEPVKLASIAANIAMVSAGTATVANLNMYTETLVYTCYMWIGGIACTFPLVLFLMRSKSKKLSALGKACLGPAIFNINEPVVFGCIAWNPIMMLPMWIIGLVIPAITWIGCKVIAFAPIPTIQFDLWYCPYPISTWISSQGSIAAVIFVIITFVVAALIWYPFFKAYEKQCVEEEMAALEQKK